METVGEHIDFVVVRNDFQILHEMQMVCDSRLCDWAEQPCDEIAADWVVLAVFSEMD